MRDNHNIFPIVLIVAAALAAYGTSFSGGFVFDDLAHIVRNDSIRTLWPPWEAMNSRVEGSVGLRPLVNLSLAGNFALGGLSAWGYHAFNLLVHALAALTLFGIVRRTLLLEPLRARYGGRAKDLALIVTLLWTVHPLQTESVTYIIQRAESMMGLFLFLCLYSVLRASESNRPRGWHALAIFSCAMGMASKLIMVMAPLIVLCYDRSFLAGVGPRRSVAGSFRNAWENRRALYLGLASTWFLFAAFLLAQPPTAASSAGFSYEYVTPLQHLSAQPGVILHYLKLVFWPHPLVLDYSWRVPRHFMEVLIPSIPVIVLVALVLWALHTRPRLGFLGAFFFLMLLPTSSFIPLADLAFEHRMYVPLAAVIVLGVVGVDHFFGLMTAPAARLARDPKGFAGRRWISYILVIVLGGGWGLVTASRNLDYESTITIWRDTISKWPINPRAHYNLGVALASEGRFNEAIPMYEKAIKLMPDYPAALNNLGIALGEVGRLEEALGPLKEAVRITPAHVEAHYNLGNALLKLGRVEAAIAEYREALRLQPDSVMAHYNLANALAREENLDDAILHFEEAVRLQPDLAEAHNNLGATWAKKGDSKRALKSLHRALELMPDDPRVHGNLGMVLQEEGRHDEAMEHFAKALELGGSKP
ncbi:MAG: tetratricopeptide repeat protein [Candidatus Omnitrophica bacterium]|nr:tetratricopeptide repeat protein [Candidatus Omnitrophota bacterium]